MRGERLHLNRPVQVLSSLQVRCQIWQKQFLRHCLSQFLLSESTNNEGPIPTFCLSSMHSTMQSLWILNLLSRSNPYLHNTLSGVLFPLCCCSLQSLTDLGNLESRMHQRHLCRLLVPQNTTICHLWIGQQFMPMLTNILFYQSQRWWNTSKPAMKGPCTGDWRHVKIFQDIKVTENFERMPYFTINF